MSAAVDVFYRHYAKFGRFMGLREAGGALFKLYHLTAPDAPVPDDVAGLCEDWFAAHAHTAAAPGDHGFVPRRHGSCGLARRHIRWPRLAVVPVQYRLAFPPYTPASAQRGQ